MTKDEIKDKIIGLQEEYITFLSERLSGHEVFMSTRRWKPDPNNVELANNFKSTIKVYKEKLNNDRV